MFAGSFFLLFGGGKRRIFGQTIFGRLTNEYFFEKIVA